MPLRRTLPVLAVLAASLGASEAAARGAGDDPLTRLRCFGAASRDPALRPCRQPRLRLAVVPAPEAAVLMPIAGCDPVQREGDFVVCGFGAPAARARGRVALIGDSHAAHWLPAVELVARRRRLHGDLIALPGCTFSRAVRDYHDDLRPRCEAWKARVLAWLREHPGVSTVFTSNFATDVPPFLTAPGADPATTEELGFARLWRQLPPSVRHVVAIRDVPQSPPATVACVAAARRAARSPACPVARGRVLLHDPQVGAVRRLGAGPRQRLVDLTSYMCGPARCFSVVGGALVHKDSNHLTQVFSATLGPYLLRAVADLLPPRPPAVAAGACATPRYPGNGYFTSLRVRRVSCAAGRRVALAHHACRTRHGTRGRCARVRGYRCRERRVASPIEFDARVTCARGARRVVFTYQQNV